MNKYNRYFRITSGPIIAFVEGVRALNEHAHKQYSEILKDLGAEPRYYQLEGKLKGLLFENRPDSGEYKRVKCGGYYPKRNTKAGRALHKRIDSVVTKSASDALELVGLSDSPTIFCSASSRIYYPTLFVKPSDPLVVFISVPWYDEDPEEIARYVEGREAGIRRDGNLDALLWEPTSDMVETKKWVIDKEIDEWNESIKNGD